MIVVALLAPARADTTTEQRWIKELLDAETMILAAIEVGDMEEMRAQSLIISRLARSTETVLVRLKGADQVTCFTTASSLAAVADTLRMKPSARNLVGARDVAALYGRALPICGQALGLKARSRLAF
ncbi:hypothetical protein [Prosthecodimorpha staleyi]|uniref:hypothetical protein n=1 Tax=Prosthecodimorpha staleyi TaxID=2840188 RepID=UPI0021C2CAF3|nr:hypothetical protein [Prosthecodimorpha staleyi]